jgi:hypothetical protein
MNYITNIFLRTYYKIKNKNEITVKLNFQMMDFSAPDIIIYQIFSLSLFLPKTIHDKFSITTNKSLATASFPNALFRRIGFWKNPLRILLL